MVLTRFPSRDVQSSRPGGGPWRHLDLVLLASVVCLSGVGLLMVYSATRQKQIAAGLDPQHYLKRQLLFLALGVIAMVVAMLVDYRALRDVAPMIWVGTVIGLLGVLTPLGASTAGTQAWYPLGPFDLQPAEIAKVAVIIAVAAYLSAHRGNIETPQIIVVLGVAAVPMALIYLQPDLGSAMVFVAMLMGLLLVAGARPRHIAALTGIGLLAIITVLQLGILREYQLDRLSAFLDPAGDTQRSAYNLRQSQIAIAAGGLTGKGVFEGTQTNLSFVPEQHTDFIFTAVGEELGFLGAVTILALFALVMWRTWRAASLARDDFGSLLCVGVLGMLLFQIFENVGMTMGITPIAGIPLPFVSYG
ncbi:MAG: rod shape-determining protein RodA, partial [Actinobacteria bacterium]|nr:rod shape-determining protein RodA [Actinomycetota bacterium]